MAGQPDPSKVFVVHGRNESIRRSIFAFLRAIGLDPIEWTQAVAFTNKATPYVGEILDAALSTAQAIVVVFTPDDEAKLRDIYLTDNDPSHDRILTPQARPNVLFEAGLAFGRAPERTILVEIGDLRPFSDIGGRHTIRLDDTTQRRQALAERLRTAGCSVDLSGTDWHTEGDFVAGLVAENTIHDTPNNTQTNKEDIPEDKLHIHEEAILKLVANGVNDIAGLTSRMGTHREVTIFRSDSLISRGLLVSVPLGINGIHFFSLTNEGRAYLINNDLLP